MVCLVTTLALKIPWMEEPCKLQSMGSQSRTWLSDFTFTFCDPMDHSLPELPVHGIFHARILEWIASPSPGDIPDILFFSMNAY